MDKQLNQIPWNQLSDAFGSAEHVPQLLRRVQHNDREDVSEALGELWNRICHQGSSYDSSVAALPFLIEIATRNKTVLQHEIISLCLGIVIGCDVDYFYLPIPAKKNWKQIREAASRNPPYGPALIGLKCYALMRNALPSFIGILDCEEDLTRYMASYAIAWFYQDYHRILPELTARFLDASSDFDIANSVLNIGVLQFNACIEFTITNEVESLLSHDAEIVRVAAAIYFSLSKVNADALLILQELVNTKEYKRYYPEIPFCSGDLIGYAQQFLESRSI